MFPKFSLLHLAVRLGVVAIIRASTIALYNTATVAVFASVVSGVCQPPRIPSKRRPRGIQNR